VEALDRQHPPGRLRGTPNTPFTKESREDVENKGLVMQKRGPRAQKMLQTTEKKTVSW
jgi:hypothetical protein